MGSLGAVEEVTSRSSPEKGTQTLARKRVLLPYHGRRQRLQIIKEEAKILEDLAHQHIIQMIASYEDTPQPGKFFYSLLMSPVGDNDLKTFLDVVGDQDRAPQEKSWLRQWFSCLTAALAYLHGEGVRHQDIKPSNIIHRDSHIFFTDFSSSSRFEVGQTTSTENPARTSAMYGAPEAIDVLQDDGKLKKHGRAADIFSLGAVFSEMLSVIDGRAVNKYHEFLSQSHALTGGQGAEAARGLLYGRSVDKVTQWFSTSGQRNIRGMFTDCIAPMLCLDREDRPEAILLLDLLAKRPFTSPCHCQFLCSSRTAQALELAKEDRGLLGLEARSGTHSKNKILVNDLVASIKIGALITLFFFTLSMILLDWSGVDLGVKSTPYAKKLVELQDSNANIYYK
ncbi:kinase-like protein [Cenococcum geophilum 1.58]|uniref:kinase-like protein n=1 Tax=Cenococcum geophilum 1.58 TaxID=794803 RepID=UPI00358F3D96|nr:kinase-like protein [Cenococcum geophilum 1.58]